jgi:hypothetical protein
MKFWMTVWAVLLAGPAWATWDRAWTKGLSADVIAQFEIALGRGETKGKRCFPLLEEPSRGPVKLRVIFDGSKGRSTDAEVQAPYAGSKVEACLKRSFVGEIVLPFDGAARTVMVTFDP